MNYSFLFTFCVLITALSSLSGAPVGDASQVDFTRCKSQAIQLNKMARDLYNEIESTKMSGIIIEPPVSIRPVDECDPQSLQNNKKTCQSRIILALKNYTTIFHNVFKNPACMKWRTQANQIASITKQLLMLQFDDQEEPAPLTVENWSGIALCRDSVERLYSFSIISARVFSFLAAPGAPKVLTKQC